MKLSRLVLNLLILSGLTSCSPFGASSFMEQIGRSLIPELQTKTSTELVSGGSQQLVTAENGYKVTISVGNQFNQPSTVTNGGYKVQATLQSNE